MLDCRHDLPPGGCIRAELVGDQPTWWTALFLQQTLQQALGRFSVAAYLDDRIKDIAVLIYRPPQSVLLAANGDHDLVQMPHVAGARPFALESASVVRSERQSPPAYRLIGNEDAAFQQHLLNQA
jgi:hypothetical protein